MSSQSECRLPVAADENPVNWRFVWESQSHTLILRLVLFNPNVNLSTECRNLKLKLIPELSILTVSFSRSDGLETSIQVPLPRVLIDAESPIHFKAVHDHIEAKLALLLPVDHTLISDFDSILNFEEKKNELRPLSMDSDVKKLSSVKEVQFYCKKCSTELTKGLRCFHEMPSVNWRDAADNWVGNCCCSFGGASEELVEKYVKSYACSLGVCLLSTTSVLLCKDDLLGCELPDVKAKKNDVESDLNSSSGSFLSKISVAEADTQVLVGCSGNHGNGFLGSQTVGNSVNTKDNIPSITEHETLDNVVNGSSSCSQIEKNKVGIDGQIQKGNSCAGCCSPNGSGALSKTPLSNAELLENQKIFLDGYLGNGFMVRSSGLSKDIQWIDFLCPECSSLIGAYPCLDDNVPLDGGVRLFKCYISTSSANSGSEDAFEKYTRERMFTCQLLEYAEHELSFRTVVRDIQTKSPLLQIILLNPNSWCCTGHTTEPGAQLVMHPTVKMLFSTISNGIESDPRAHEDWVRENQVDEVFMFSAQTRELIQALKLGNVLLPPSYESLQGLFLSFLKR